MALHVSASNVGDVKEIISNKQLIVEKENYKLLAKKIIDFLKLEKNVRKKLKMNQINLLILYFQFKTF